MGKTKDGFFTAFVIIVCALAGETISLAISKNKALAFLTTSLTIGTPKPISLDFLIFNFTIGFNLKLNLFSLLGIIAGIIILKNKGGSK